MCAASLLCAAACSHGRPGQAPPLPLDGVRHSRGGPACRLRWLDGRGDAVPALQPHTRVPGQAGGAAGVQPAARTALDTPIHAHPCAAVPRRRSRLLQQRNQPRLPMPTWGPTFAPHLPAGTFPSSTNTAAACACGPPTAAPSASAPAANRRVSSRGHRMLAAFTEPALSRQQGTCMHTLGSAWRVPRPMVLLHTHPATHPCAHGPCLRTPAPTACLRLPWLQWARCQRSPLCMCSPCRAWAPPAPMPQAAAGMSAPHLPWRRRRHRCGYCRAPLLPGAGTDAGNRIRCSWIRLALLLGVAAPPNACCLC